MGGDSQTLKWHDNFERCSITADWFTLRSKGWLKYKNCVGLWANALATWSNDFCGKGCCIRYNVTNARILNKAKFTASVQWNNKLTRTYPSTPIVINSPSSIISCCIDPAWHGLFPFLHISTWKKRRYEARFYLVSSSLLKYINVP